MATYEFHFDNDPAESTSLEDFLEANEDSFEEDEKARLRELEVGHSITGGGGAQPFWTFTRTS